jgi:hypothetical protein
MNENKRIDPMSSKVPAPSAALNRLRAAAGLLPQIEAGLRDGKIAKEKAALSAEFCRWALDNAAEAGPDGEPFALALASGLESLRRVLEAA